MLWDLQTLVAGAAVLLAAAYIAWRIAQVVLAKQTGGCGAKCSGCPSPAGAEPRPVVQIVSKKQDR